MKKADTFWQGVILFLVFCFTLGIYALLAVAARPLLGRGRDATPATGQDNAVQLVAPLPGTVVQRLAEIPVRAVVVAPGALQAELCIDGQLLTSEANPDPQAVPWTVEFVWQEAGEGAHHLAVQALGAGGELAASAPVTVTVVPAGKLAFASNRDGAYALYAMQTDGAGLLRLSTGPGDVRQPAWAPGGQLTFVAEGQAGQATIRRLAASGEVEDLAFGRDPAWSPDGRWLAYSASVEGISQVFVADAQGRESRPLTAETVYAGQPAWSPGGARVAYVAERAGNLDIWIVAADGGEPLRLTDDPATDWAPAWSPDGARLAFVSDRGGSYQLYAMHADGSQVEALTDLAQGAEAPAWSPDGYWLAFVAYTGEGAGVNAREIYLMRADGREPVRLTHNAYDDTEPDWAAVP
jgi:dipeptidyl aminopeptidase/acylaminoacyl peptidase